MASMTMAFSFVANRLLITATLILFAWPTGTLYAQLSTASVTGVVTDNTGGVIADASVALRNIATSVERKTVSNTVGNFQFVNVPPGDYTMETSAPGFKSNRVTRFTLGVSQTATMDQILELGPVNQTVTVEAATERIQTATAELGTVISEKQVTDLPLNGRNFTQLLTLTPGVAPISVAQNSAGYGAAVGAGSQFTFPAINGQTNRSNLYYTDGINNTGSFVGTYGVPPIIDAIQEFKINSHNDSTQFGGTTGGIINVVTKSGTNELHGSAWEYLRNNAFDARSTFQPSVTPFRQNQFGASGGGPVVIPKLYNGHNRSFFFVAYQGFRYIKPQNTFFRVPTDANLAGDFSDEPRQIFNPFSTRPDPGKPAGFIRDPFPGNQIPVALLNPGMVAFAKATLPKPVATAVVGRNAVDTTSFRQNQEEYTARFDQTVGSKDFLWFRISGLKQTTDSSGGRPGLAATADRPAMNYGASYVHTFSPSLIVEGQYGRLKTQDNAATHFASGLANLAKTIGFSPSFSGGFTSAGNLIPALNVADYFSGGESISVNPSLNDIHQYKAAVSKVLGTHTLAFGGELDSTNYESFLESANLGFSTAQTSNPANSSQIGNALASFLLGVPDSAGRRNVHETVRWGGVMGIYFSDSWKATSRLTVNLGLRYDRTWINPYGRESTIAKSGGIETGNMDVLKGIYILQKLPPSCAQRGFAPCIPTPDGSLPAHVVVDPRGKILYDTPTNWAPRLGLAYRLGQKTAIRSGFGIFYDNWAGITQRSQGYEGNWPDVAQQLANNLNAPIAANPTPNITAQDPFLAGAKVQFPAPTPFNNVAWYIDPNIRNPYSMQWNFGVQHQLNQSTAVTANYVGSGTRRTSVGGYNNVAMTLGPGDPRQRSPFPYMTPTYFERSSGSASYNAFQFQFERRFTSGFAYQVAYTYSKSIDTGSSGFYGVEGFSIQNPYNTRPDRSVSAYDLTHVLSINLLAELPIGKGKLLDTGNRFANHLLGDWQVNTLTVARSGAPYFVRVTGDIANTGNINYMRGNLVGDPRISDPNRDRWFNTTAFAIPANYTFGNLGRNTLRSDPFWNIDLSVFRQFPFLEGRRFEFRAEAFNVVNTVVYAPPDSNLASRTFGSVFGTANNPRVLQLGLKLIF